MARARCPTNVLSDHPKQASRRLLARWLPARRLPFKPLPPVPLPGDGTTCLELSDPAPAGAGGLRALVPMTIVVMILAVVAMQSGDWQPQSHTADPLSLDSVGETTPFSLQGVWRGLSPDAPANAPTVVAPISHATEVGQIGAEDRRAGPKSTADASRDTHVATHPEVLAVEKPATLAANSRHAVSPPDAATAVDATTIPEAAQTAVPRVAVTAVGAMPVASSETGAPPQQPPSPTHSEADVVSGFPGGGVPPITSSEHLDVTPLAAPRKPDLLHARSLRDTLRLPRRKPDWILRMAVARTASAQRSRGRPERQSPASATTFAATQADTTKVGPNFYGRLEHRSP